jgi:ribosome-binding protein aMBF1 (putative translation factor)
MSKFDQYLAEDYKFGNQEEANNKAFTREELAKKLKIKVSEVKSNSVKGRTDLWIVDGVTYKKK